MSSHKVIQDTLQQHGARQVAEGMGVSLSLVYKWAEPTEHGSGTPNPLDRIAALLRCTGDARIAQWVCEQAGGFYVRNPTTQGDHVPEVLPATSRIMQEFADMLSVIAQAALDNDISTKETAGIRRRWEDLKSVTEGFVRSCEEGDFARVRKELRGQ